MQRQRERESDPVKVSKALSYLLRHAAAKEGVPIRSDGYALVDDLLRHKSLKGVTKQDVLRVVDSNDKKRFSICQHEAKLYIRANQGHSLKTVSVDMKRITAADQAPVAIHGTYRSCMEAILNEGLRPMSRQHIHFAAGERGHAAVVSGMRKSAEVMIYMDVAKMLADGIPLYMSENRVLLSPGNAEGRIPPDYFAKVVDRTSPKQPSRGLAFDDEA